MAYKILLSDEALEDVDEILDFYCFDLKNKDLANKFLVQLYKSYKSLEKFANYQFRHEQFRAYPMGKFPYLIFYELFEEEQVVKISTIFPTLKDPRKIKI